MSGSGLARENRLGRRRPSRWRAGIVVVLALAATGLMQHWTLVERREAVATTPVSSSASASISNLSSFSLALLLGGLRGPLVMYLWSSSENQKHQHDLSDFDTKIEMIRQLQPEFVSVHIFQMWNKAFNVSADMTNLADKYSAILDAIDYGDKVDQERPNDLNILASLGRVWFDKLGNSHEKQYYTQRVMEETKWRKPDPAELQGAGFRRFRLDPMLDPQGNILAPLLEPHPPATHIGRTRDGEEYDGSKLQFLAQFQPFPYGLEPMAIGFNYYKRTQVLMDATGQKPLETSDNVVDSRPAVMLRLWADDMLERARNLEVKAVGLSRPDTPEETSLDPTDELERIVEDQLSSAKKFGAGSIVDKAAARDALYFFGFAHRIIAAAYKEYDRYLHHYASHMMLYEQHLADLKCLEHMDDGDYNFMAWNAGLAADVAIARRQAIQSYIMAKSDLEYYIIKHYTDDQTVAEGVGIARLSLERDKYSDAQWTAWFDRVQAILGRVRRQQADYPTRQKALFDLQRVNSRLEILQASAAAPAVPAAKP